MPSWTREAIRRREDVLVLASTVTRTSDPAIDDRHGYARSVRSFIDVEYLASNAELRIYRYGGATSDRLRLLDTSAPGLVINGGGLPITTLLALDWDEPLPPFGSLRVDAVRTGGSSALAIYRVVNSYLAD